MASSNDLDTLSQDGESSPSATQGAGSTTPRKALSLRPWWTRDRSVIACLTETMP